MKSVSLKSVKKNLDQFKEKYPRKRSYPQKLWKDIEELSQTISVSKISKELSLDACHISRKIKYKKIKNDVTDFVKLPPVLTSPSINIPVPTMELQLPNGIIVKIFGQENHV